MKRLIVLAVFAFACWYGWNHYQALLHPPPRHVAVIHNDTNEKLVRIRLTICDHTYVKEELAPAASVTFPFRVSSDSNFDLTWEYDSNASTGHWAGGLVTKGPMVARHTLTIREGGGVILQSKDN